MSPQKAASGLEEIMARYTGPVCRLCRRERTKLFLKGERCYSMKCPVSEAVTDRHSRAYPPGEHGRDRMRQGSEDRTQLRENQKARRIYGLLEKQFRNLYEESSRQPGITGENLLRNHIDDPVQEQLIVELYSKEDIRLPPTPDRPPTPLQESPTC